jgi:hypothetical protein
MKLDLNCDWGNGLDEEEVSRTHEIIKSISNPMSYSFESTMDRMYAPFQRLNRHTRRIISKHNNLTELDLKSAQLNILIALVCGDIDTELVYNSLRFNETKHALRVALKNLDLSDNEKAELRYYRGDFYTKVIEALDLDITRQKVKTPTVSFLNCLVDDMWKFKNLMNLFTSTDALSKVLQFLKDLKDNDNKNAYQVLFQIEAMIIRMASDKAIENGMGINIIHDAISCHIDHAKSIHQYINDACKYYGVGSFCEMEIFEEYEDEDELSVELDDDFDEMEDVLNFAPLTKPTEGNYLREKLNEKRTKTITTKKNFKKSFNNMLCMS